MSRKWQPSPVFLHGKSHVERSLVAYSPWGHKESDTTEQLSTMEKTKINFSSMCEFGQGVDFIRQFTESANLEKSTVAIELEKVSFHSSPKERQ